VHNIKTSDFNYNMPQSLIAQQPCEPRDAARLLCLSRTDGNWQHRIFSDLPQLLHPGDVLVLNDSKVLSARLIGQKASGGVCEVLLLREQQTDVWECLARPGKRMKAGTVVTLGDGTLQATILATLPNGGKMVRFTYDTQTLYEKLDAFGKMPVPPYITQQLRSSADYQTVYAKNPGSAAAPTAGLHFTPQLLQNLEEAGVKIAYITLHIGLGTFRPVQEDVVEDHLMHSEWYNIDQKAAETIQAAKRAGGRIVAVGTTSCRTLEAVASQYGAVCAASGDTNIFIYPGYQFKTVDGLITNFHLPESTLLVLVSAFSGYENAMNAYRMAVEEKYRFYSFGDAMLII
jgi:S-adenosylmethionine:tRNA ribosyltransferase-isomerase